MSMNVLNDRIGCGSTDALARALGAITSACTALTAIPPASVASAILWTGYFGARLAAHLSIV